VSAWTRFRALPAATQAAAWLGLAVAYTLVLVLLLGGDGDGNGGAGSPQATRAPMDEGEREIAEQVESVDVKVAEPNDVAAFRKPDVRSVECEDGRCTIDYMSGLPGRGRIFEDQQQMLAGIFAEDSIDEVTLRVFRASSVGPNTPAKATEETMPGSPILITECARTGRAERADAGKDARVPRVPAECRSVPLSQGANQGNSAAPREGRGNSANGGPGILDGG
jgi:hypothetical protein